MKGKKMNKGTFTWAVEQLKQGKKVKEDIAEEVFPFSEFIMLKEIIDKRAGDL